ncbi:hypothetical protein Hanom_Chr03g00227631 [Helianthus anomalus]
MLAKTPIISPSTCLVSGHLVMIKKKPSDGHGSFSQDSISHVIFSNFVFFSWLMYRFIS